MGQSSVSISNELKLPSLTTTKIIHTGMRGSGDTSLAPGIETEVLESVVAAQTEILTALWGNESVQNPDIVPQMWCLYKEVQGYYEAGMKVSEYITRK